MRYALATTCFVLGAALAPVAAHAADGDTDRANPKLFVKDSVITTKIKTKLATEHAGSLNHIKVDTDQNGVVWMTGSANSQQEIDQAIPMAKNTEGVKIGQGRPQGPEGQVIPGRTWAPGKTRRGRPRFFSTTVGCGPTPDVRQRTDATRVRADRCISGILR